MIRKLLNKFKLPIVFGTPEVEVILSSKRPLLAILGPTGKGKSCLALSIVEYVLKNQLMPVDWFGQTPLQISEEFKDFEKHLGLDFDGCNLADKILNILSLEYPGALTEHRYAGSITEITNIPKKSLIVVDSPTYKREEEIEFFTHLLSRNQPMILTEMYLKYFTPEIASLISKKSAAFVYSQHIDQFSVENEILAQELLDLNFEWDSFSEFMLVDQIKNDLKKTTIPVYAVENDLMLTSNTVQ